MKTRIHPLVIVLVVLFIAGGTKGCDADFAREQSIAESNARIARACIPERNEQRVLQWTVVDGQYLLYLTIREPLAPRPNRNVQFIVTSESELPL